MLWIEGKHNAERTALTHGHEDGEVTLGDRRFDTAGHGSGPLTARRRCS